MFQRGEQVVIVLHTVLFRPFCLKNDGHTTVTWYHWRKPLAFCMQILMFQNHQRCMRAPNGSGSELPQLSSRPRQGKGKEWWSEGRKDWKWGRFLFASLALERTDTDAHNHNTMTQLHVLVILTTFCGKRQFAAQWNVHFKFQLHNNFQLPCTWNS